MSNTSYALEKEPPMSYILNVNGQNYEIDLGRPARLQIDKDSYKVLLQKAPYRKFDFYELKFDFPSNYSYSHDKTNPNVETWKLSLNPNNVTVHKFEFDIDEKGLVDVLLPQLKSQFKGLPISEGKVELKTKTNLFKGVSLTVRINEIITVIELYPIKTTNCIFALLINDLREDPKIPSSEYKNIQGLLNDTLVIDH